MPRLSDPKLLRWAKAHNFRLYAWKIDEDEATLIRLLPPQYDYAAEAQRRFGSAQRRKEWLAARVLLHVEAGINERLSYNANGRPLLPSTKQYLSISHSRNFVFLQLSSQPVGLDVETHSPRAFRLRERFLSRDEMPLLTALSATDEQRATLLWCAKEAAFKCFPNDQSTTISQVHLQLAEQPKTLIAHINMPTNETETETNVHLLLTPEYALAVCQNRPPNKTYANK